jgi:hypothetical protein
VHDLFQQPADRRIVIHNQNLIHRQTPSSKNIVTPLYLLCENSSTLG